jgi:hypothetical protein
MMASDRYDFQRLVDNNEEVWLEFRTVTISNQRREVMKPMPNHVGAGATEDDQGRMFDDDKGVVPDPDCPGEVIDTTIGIP